MMDDLLRRLLAHAGDDDGRTAAVPAESTQRIVRSLDPAARRELWALVTALHAELSAMEEPSAPPAPTDDRFEGGRR